MIKLFKIKEEKNIDKEYQKLLISELLIALMKQDFISVRELAKEAGISLTIIQELKTGKRKNIILLTFNCVINAIGYEIDIKPIKYSKHA